MSEGKVRFKYKIRFTNTILSKEFGFDMKICYDDYAVIIVFKILENAE